MHLLTRHGVSCDQCQKQFFNEVAVLQHKKDAHGDTLLVDDEKRI